MSTEILGTWHSKDPWAAIQIVEVLSVFKDGEVEFVVYKQPSGFKYIKGLTVFKADFSPTPSKPKYVKGGLYTPKVGSGDVILLFTEPGFQELGRDPLWSSTTYYEYEYGVLIPIKMVGPNYPGKHPVVQL